MLYVQDYALWDVIENGNSFKPVAQTTTNANGTLTSLIPGLVTTKEKAQKKNDVKARSMLLMALPNEHLMTFNQYKDVNESSNNKLPFLKQGEYDMWRLRIEQYFQVQDYALWDVIENGNSFKLVAQTTTNADGTLTSLIPDPYKDAKTLFAAIQTRFGDNEATKKTHKTFLKQIWLSWVKIFHKKISIEFWEVSLLSRNTHVVFWRNKPDLDTMSFNDLYNNFKIIKQEVKGTASSSSSSSSHNMAFCHPPSSTNEVNTAYGVSTANTQISHASTQVSTTSTQVSTTNLSDDTVYAFLASQSNGSQLVYEDLEKIHNDDIEEMDLKWQLAMLSMRTRRFFQKTGRKITINRSNTVGYDKSRVECFNCHKMRHFTRECKGPRNQGSRNRNQDSSRKTLNVEETSSKSMVAIDGAGFDWSYMADVEVPINMALMAFSDSEVHNDKTCSKTFLKSFETLKTQLDDLRIEFNKSELNLATYKRGLASMKEQLVFYKKNEVIFYEQLAVLKRDISYKDSEICRMLKRLFSPPKFVCPNLVLEEFHQLSLKAIGTKNMVPRAVLMKSGLRSLNTVRPITTAYPKTIVYSARPIFTVFFLASKDETSGILKNFITEIENQVDKKVKIIICDNGTDFKNRIMSEFYEQKGIKREFSMARTPQQNGVTERRNRTLIEATRTMLADSKLPSTFWAGAVNTACYVHNKVLIVKPHNKTPYELFRGRTPALSFIRPFRCHVTILNTLDYLGKFDGKSDEGFFVRYSLNSKAFRVYNIKTRKVEENLHIRFLEDKPIITGDGPKWLFDIDVLTKSMNYVPVVAGTNSNDLVDGSLFDSSLKNASNDEPQPSSDAEKKDDEGVCKESGIADFEKSKNSIQGVNTAGPSINTEPDMFSLGDNDIATHANFFSDETKVDMSNINTTYLVPFTLNTRIHKDHSLNHVIGDVQSGVLTRRMTKTINKQRFISVVYEGKSHEDLHTCLLACLLSQEEPKKFKLQEVWTLVDLSHGKRAIGTKWVYRNKKDERGIVIRNKASLVAQGYTQEEGIDYDEVFASVSKIESIRLKRKFMSVNLQGLKIQSSLTEFIRVKSDILLVQVYVNDIIFGSTKKNLCTEFKKLKHKKFQMSSMGELTFFLGLQVTQNDDGIFISQDKYVDEILKKFGFLTVKPTSTPMETLKLLLKDAEAKDVDVHLYRSMIGSLMYLTSSRPDIMFADSSFDLEAYSDSDYAGASLDWKSTIGEPITDEAANEEHVPIDSNDPLLSCEDRLKLTELLELCTNLSERVLDLENTKTSQAAEITKLKERVKKLGRRNKSRILGLKRLRKVGRSAQVVSSEDEGLGAQEDASKQGRKIADLDADAEVTLVDEAQERNDDNLMFDTGVFDEQEVEVEKVVSTAKVTTASATTTTINELTLAQTLIEIKAAKPKAITTATATPTTAVTRPKARGVVVQEPSEFTTINELTINEPSEKVVSTTEVTTASATTTTINELTLAQTFAQRLQEE
ncbi:putative ribonuclease H-like domain-containing protein [Tanacetum coccineum]